ncbi:MAG: nucleotide excision repair endonuclease [Myxococcota bacterium]|nr:nucleotide excision repair endonuclease [Myxococcota bacterium]
MGLRRFDRKFGAQLVRELPDAPGVYLFKDAGGRVLYAGKAKSLRRRLASYRNASRRKAHRKMRTLVREAASLEVRHQPSERAALILENELIRTLRPPYNVDGAYSFLYPAIGLGGDARQALLCFTTHPDAWDALGLDWFGVFRSRPRALEAFEALAALLGRAGHREPRKRLPEAPRLRGSRLAGFRRVDADWLASTRRFLAGESDALLAELALHLLERPDARREADAVGDELRCLEAFFRGDLTALRDALRASGRGGHFVGQDERDTLFLASRRDGGE